MLLILQSNILSKMRTTIKQKPFKVQYWQFSGFDESLFSPVAKMEMLMDVSINKTNHSLFSARIAEDLTPKQGGVMLNSEGQRGEKETFGVRAAWLGFYGQRKTGCEGIVIMQHPSSRWFPSKWFTRDYGFMSPTPMYWPDDGEQTRLKKGETVRLKYRVLIFGGTPEEAGIQALYKQYASE